MRKTRTLGGGAERARAACADPPTPLQKSARVPAASWKLAAIVLLNTVGEAAGNCSLLHVYIRQSLFSVMTTLV